MAAAQALADIVLAPRLLDFKLGMKSAHRGGVELQDAGGNSILTYA
jgi:hypothetical protein